MAFPIRFVLVRPRRSGNVGAVARALACFPVAELVLVQPRARIGVTAARRAVRGVEILEQRRQVASLDEALADCVRVVATIGRVHAGRERVVAVRESAAGIVSAAAAGPVAVVFGPEDHGLSRSEISVCHELATIPSGPDEASLNLSHAAAIFAYEILLASADAPVVERTAARPESLRRVLREQEAALATAGEREAMVAHIGDALLAIGFLKPQGTERDFAELRRLFDRVAPTRREVRLVRGIARRALGTLARAGGSTRLPPRA